MKTASALLCAVVVAGCSTQPVATSKTTPVPADRVLSTAYSKPAKDSGTLVVKRDSGLIGSGCNWTVSINGGDIAVLASEESVALYLPPGEAIVGVRPKVALCAGALIETEVMIHPGRVKALRLSVDWTGTFRLSPTAQ